ncbi:hypothetical protein CHU98_g7437 [Xylaria longipes]|nr:hypothetical protein CHU98_g7437 [Xylaria longipes]
MLEHMFVKKDKMTTRMSNDPVDLDDLMVNNGPHPLELLLDHGTVVNESHRKQHGASTLMGSSMDHYWANSSEGKESGKLNPHQRCVRASYPTLDLDDYGTPNVTPTIGSLTALPNSSAYRKVL